MNTENFLIEYYVKKVGTRLIKVSQNLMVFSKYQNMSTGYRIFGNVTEMMFH